MKFYFYLPFQLHLHFISQAFWSVVRTYYPTLPSALCKAVICVIYPGSHLLSHTVSSAVPSAVQGLTIVFGMGTGVSPERITTRNLMLCPSCTVLHSLDFASLHLAAAIPHIHSAFLAFAPLPLCFLSETCVCVIHLILKVSFQSAVCPSRPRLAPAYS